MKNWILPVLILATFVSGCRKDVNIAQPVALSLMIKHNAENTSFKMPLDKIKVTLSNNNSGQTYMMESDASGRVSFPSIVPGNYSVSASLQVDADFYNNATGLEAEDDVPFNAALSGTLINKDQTLELELTPGRVGDLVIKQVYYAGSHTTQGAAWRDQFLEIYNNSNKTIYLDSLYIGNGKANGKKLSEDPNPWDWSKSVGMPSNAGDPNRDFVYARYLFMIPGTGKQHPLEPGESIILAGNGINHKSDYTDVDGKPITIGNPELTIDLSGAAFEAYLQDYAKSKSANPITFKPYRFDINGNVPDLEVVFCSPDNDWVADANGKEDYFIFRLDAPRSFKAYPDPTVLPENVSITTVYFPQIAIRSVIDAVELQEPNASNRTAKRLPASLDGGPTNVPGGRYSSQSLVRKTKKVVNGRRILQDTNNSANDFVTKMKADPSRSASSFQ